MFAFLLILFSQLVEQHQASTIPLNFSNTIFHPVSHAWTGWQTVQLEDTPSSQAAIVYSQGAASDIFYRNLAYELVHSKISTDGTISNTVNRGAVLLSEPRAVSPAPGEYTVVVTNARHNVLLGRLSASNVWTWTGLYGHTDSAPAIASAGPDTLHIFRRGPDNILYRKSIFGGSSTGWLPMGVYMMGSPAAFSVADGTFDLVIRDYKNSLLHNRFSMVGEPGEGLVGGDWKEIPSSQNTMGDPKMTKTRDHELLLYAMKDGFLSRYAFDGVSWRILNPGQSKWLQSTPSLVDSQTRFQVVDIFQTKLHFLQFVY